MRRPPLRRFRPSVAHRAGLDSARPSNLSKIKTKDKGKSEAEAQHAAYGALV
ncbi:MAG: hypothetical protein LBP58_06580 [Azoarcus sp.]|jgi:hypothetical protein|nr:hypothetical protein [Azoarcus sp.]